MILVISIPLSIKSGMIGFDTSEPKEEIEFFVFYEDDNVTVLYPKRDSSSNLPLKRLREIFDRSDWDKFIK
jgi:hypothetical protein